MTINLAERLLARGQTLQGLGLFPQATRLFQRLTSCRELPADVAEEAQRSLAELHLSQGQCRLARRALAAALAQRPDEPHYHYLMGVAVLDDPKGAPGRALKHFAAAVRNEPDNAEYQVEYGLLALVLGMTRKAVQALRRAAELAADEPELLGQVAVAGGEAGRLAPPLVRQRRGADDQHALEPHRRAA